MNQTPRKFAQQSPGRAAPSVLDDREHIAGLPHAKRSSVEEAREHPNEVEACKSVLDGPACIRGLPR
jgi:hypothetical protein